MGAGAAALGQALRYDSAVFSNASITLRILAAAGLTALVTSGCDATSRTPSSEPLLVFAAASLTDAFGDLVADFATRNEVEVHLSFGGSSALREQILDGAPADVFASADPETMAAVVQAGHAASEPATFARNHLVLAVPLGNPAGVTGLSDLGRDELLVGLCAAPVPCGRLAALVLDDAALTARPDTLEPDARALRSKLEHAELDVGLVYASDVWDSDRIEDVDPVDGDRTALDRSTDYPAVALRGAHPAAADFVAYLRSDHARSILDGHGFGMP